MGEFNTVGLEDIIDAFSRREAATVEAVPKMLKAGADVLIEAQRAEAQAMGLNETGGFINSIKATDVKGDDTEKYVEIYPQGRAKHGNDRKGDKSKVRYATIGFVAEYGTSSHAARPYMTVANEKAHEKVVEAHASRSLYLKSTTAIYKSRAVSNFPARLPCFPLLLFLLRRFRSLCRCCLPQFLCRTI